MQFGELKVNDVFKLIKRNNDSGKEQVTESVLSYRKVSPFDDRAGCTYVAVSCGDKTNHFDTDDIKDDDEVVLES